MEKDPRDQKYQVCISITRHVDEILSKVGEGVRSNGVRLLTERYAASEAADIRNEMEILPQARVPVPGDHAFVWPRETRRKHRATDDELNERIRHGGNYTGSDTDDNWPEDSLDDT